MVVVEESEAAFDERDDGVERGRDRLQREDERDEHGAGGEAVLQQLQSDVVRGQPGGGDAGTDDGSDQERGADEFGDCPTPEVDRARASAVHPATPPMSAPRSASASRLTE